MLISLMLDALRVESLCFEASIGSGLKKTNQAKAATASASARLTQSRKLMACGGATKPGHPRLGRR